MAVTTFNDMTATSKESQLNTKRPRRCNKIKFIMINIGLALSIFVAAMDVTILATSFTKISNEFKAFEKITWVASSYLLMTTAFQPLYGKISDIFGRKATLQFLLLIFLLGSILCGISTDITMLIIFRALSGVGGGGLILMSTIIISDLVPLKQRGLYMGMVGINFALAGVMGPLLGGIITDKLSWRFIFYLNLPICIIVIVINYFFLDLPANRQDLKTKLTRIDYGGAITLVSFIIFTVIGLNWGGNEYPWDSPAVVVTLVFAMILLFCFITIELTMAKEPIIPFHILNRNVTSSILIAFLNEAVFSSMVVYMTIYWQVVDNKTALEAGIELIPLIFSLIIFSIAAGIFISKTGIYRPLLIIGTLLVLLSTSLLGSLMRSDISRLELTSFRIIMGVGVGLCIETTVIVSHAAVSHQDVAVVTSLKNFFQSMGGIFGLTINGAIFKNTLHSHLYFHLPSNIDHHHLSSFLSNLDSIPSNLKPIVTQGYTLALRSLFLTSISFATLAFIASLWLVHLPISDDDEDNQVSSQLPQTT